MPRGVYDRKGKSKGEPKKQARKAGNGYAALLDKLLAEREKAQASVVALGTAIDALEELTV